VKAFTPIRSKFDHSPRGCDAGIKSTSYKTVASFTAFHFEARMDRQQWDGWAQWRWQRLQQLVGALLIAVPAGLFLYCLTQNFDHDVSVKENDHRGIDHYHIAAAIGVCHLSGDPSTWPVDWLRTLGIGQLADEKSSGSTRAEVQPHDNELTSFERAALYHSQRLTKERKRFLDDAEERQDRARRNQLRILCLSAAAAFLISLRALAGNKDEDAAFRTLMKGALLPISVLALLMPVLATAVSGITTFDNDPNVVVRDVRTISQLEQLHGRIAEDITSDPYLCRITWATNERPSADGSVLPVVHVPKVDRASLGKCVDDRMNRTTAWTQRHEQILSDATQTLAHPGDLPGQVGKAQPPAQDKKAPEAKEGAATPALAKSSEIPGDFCREAFAQWSAPISPQSQQTMNDAATPKPKPM